MCLLGVDGHCTKGGTSSFRCTQPDSKRYFLSQSYPYLPTVISVFRRGLLAFWQLGRKDLAVTSVSSVPRVIRRRRAIERAARVHRSRTKVIGFRHRSDSLSLSYRTNR